MGQSTDVGLPLFITLFCRLLLKLSQFYAIIIINERSVHTKERSNMKTTEQQHNERKRELKSDSHIRSVIRHGKLT